MNQWMKENFLESIKGIKYIVNIYITTYGIILLGLIISYLTDNNSTNNNQQISIPILQIDVYVEYYSMVFGFLFMVFISVLYLRIHQFKILIDEIKSYNTTEMKDLICSIKYLPWIASPFHKSKRGILFFKLIIIFGMVNLILLSIGHIFMPNYQLEVISREAFKLIGYFCAFVFFFSLLIVYFIWNDIHEINSIIREM